MPSVQTNTPHPVRTARRKLVYVFTPKHHGGDGKAACWGHISLVEEFGIFDQADGRPVADGQDCRQVADPEGNLYGYQVLPNGSLRELGTWHQQMAEFPAPHDGAPWHGYPIWPNEKSLVPPQFNGDRCRPHKAVFARMEELGHITHAQHKRLKRGDWI